MAEKLFTNIRLGLKVDTLENWKSSSLVLKRGEVAFATVAASAGTGLSEPVCMMKIGDGEHTFSELGFDFYAKASDVLAACKSEAGLKAFVNSVIADAGIASDDAMQELAGRVTTAEGEIDTLQSEMDAVEAKAAANETAIGVNAAAIAALEELVGDEKVADQITKAINALNLATTYEAKGEAAKVQTALDTYKTSNDAAVLANTNNITANTNAINAIKDGTTLDSFADVEGALAGKETAGAAAQALVDAKAYADGLAGNYDAKGAAATAESNAKAYAKEYADGLAGNYDAAGSAAAAEAAAKKHADDELERLVGDKTVNTQITEYVDGLKLSENYDAKGAAAAAESAAKSHADGLNTAMNTRVEALEAIDHDHANKAELDKIVEGDKAKWDAMEQNAKDYADGLDEAMDERVAELEAMFGDGEGTVEAQIEAAVAAETKLREEADTALEGRIAAIEGDYLVEADKTALQDQITELDGLVGDKKVSEQITDVTDPLAARVKAVEDDYLKAADKTELEGKITANANAIELLTNGVSAEEVDGVNDLIQYVKDHGTEVTGIKKDIKDNADAIDAIESDYLKAADKTELSGLITGLDTRMGAAETAIGTKAAQTDLEALAGRVTTVEGDLNTETTGLKARMTTAEADIDALEALVGDESVSDQIDAALAAAKEDASNKDAVVLAEITAAVEQHNTDKAALEAEIAKKANDADLAAIAKTGSTDDLVQGQLVLVFDCGTSAI